VSRDGEIVAERLPCTRSVHCRLTKQQTKAEQEKRSAWIDRPPLSAPDPVVTSRDVNKRKGGEKKYTRSVLHTRKSLDSKKAGRQ